MTTTNVIRNCSDELMARNSYLDTCRPSSARVSDVADHVDTLGENETFFYI